MGTVEEKKELCTFLVELEFETTENSEFLMRKIFEVAIFDAKNQLDSKLIKSLRLRKVYKISGPANKENAKEEIS